MGLFLDFMAGKIGGAEKGAVLGDSLFQILNENQGNVEECRSKLSKFRND